MRSLLLISLMVGCGKSNDLAFGGGGIANENPDDGGGSSGDGSSDDGGAADDTGNTDADGSTLDGIDGDGDADGGDADDTGTGDGDGDDDGAADGDEDTGFTLEGTGYNVSDIAYNLTATNQSGLPFTLHSLYGQKIVLVVGNMDVSTTIDTLEGIQEISGDHTDVRFIAYIGNDTFGVACTQACAAEVASTYGLSAVVFGGTDAFSIFNTWVDGSNTHTYLIHSSMEIYYKKSGTANGDALSSRIDNLE
jgi:hypothetical protein